MLGLILGAVLMQATAAAAPRTTITGPDWVHKPSTEDMARHMPSRAARWEVDGKVVIGCAVAADGRLVACRVSSESPLDFGFGDAALQLSQLFQMRPLDSSGAPVDGGHINIPIMFWLPRSGTLATVRGTSAKFAGARVEVDCRVIGSKLDNCFTAKAQPFNGELASAAEGALGGSGVTPDARPSGRVIVPVEFQAP